jgi:hypothetical protein
MSTIIKGNEYMQAVLYTGTGNAQSISCGFQPDMVWIKSRSAATNHKITDSVRGATKALISNTISTESTDSTGITAFTSTGFTLGASTDYNNSSATYVAWCWKAGGAAVTNTSGTIASQVSANPEAGFSIVTYTGNGIAGATVGHGLGVKPSFFVTLARSSAQSRLVYSSTINATNYLILNATDASAATSTAFNNTEPTSSVFSLGTSTTCNGSGTTYVAYCWAEIAGFSKFGRYTGNGSDNGTFVYTGFLPKYVLIKRTDSADQWMLHDTGRNPRNTMTSSLYLNLANVEDQSWFVDALSNGFKIRSGGSTAMNTNNGNYTYIAFAESPFKYVNAR